MRAGEAGDAAADVLRHDDGDVVRRLVVSARMASSTLIVRAGLQRRASRAPARRRWPRRRAWCSASGAARRAPRRGRRASSSWSATRDSASIGIARVERLAGIGVDDDRRVFLIRRGRRGDAEDRQEHGQDGSRQSEISGYATRNAYSQSTSCSVEGSPRQPPIFASCPKLRSSSLLFSKIRRSAASEIFAALHKSLAIHVAPHIFRYDIRRGGMVPERQGDNHDQ